MKQKKPFIEISNCTKKFNQLVAVNNVSLKIYTGECMGLLGPNGAGKTTLVELIENIHKPNSGYIQIDGKSWNNHEKELKSLIGVSLQENNFFEKLTVYESILMFATLYKNRDKQKVEELIQMMHLEEKKNTYFPKLSGGQKQKLALAIALVNDPKLLILDEPTTGLDPNSRKNIWDTLLQLKKKGMTIIITTHYMEEAELLCDNICMMNEGGILTKGTLAELLKEHLPYDKIHFYVSKSLPKENLNKNPDIINFHTKKTDNKIYYSIKVKDMKNSLREILKIVETNKISLDNLECKKSNLNDLFLKLAGRKLT